MSTLAQLKRFYLIIDKLDNAHFPPSMEEIHSYLEDEGYGASTRTIQRDIERLRLKFGIDVQWDPDRQGYYIDYEHSVNVNNFYSFLEYANTADLLTESIMGNKEILDYIHFESQGQLKGITLLRDIMFAIQNKKKIKFAHRKFTSDQVRNFTMKPYGLKEYQSRWYVVGEIEGRDNYLKFGIDRIENLEITSEIFQPDEVFDMNELFDDVIGLQADKEKQKVVLHFDRDQGKYIKTLPLHHSQKILEDNKAGLTIELNIRPNFELTQKILMQAHSVKVLEPQWFAEDLKNIYKSALEKYSD